MVVVLETTTDLDRKKNAMRGAGVHHGAGATASLVTRSTNTAANCANALTHARQVCGDYNMQYYLS